MLNVRPVENYNAPELPTLEEASNNPAPLKKLPKRWKKNAVVIAGIGILGAAALMGCYDSYDCEDHPRIFSGFSAHQQLDLTLRLHGGGGGSASYVVHLTEQEALSIIRMQLEAAGLNLAYEPPAYTTQGSGWGVDIDIDFFDCPRGVAISHISWTDSNQPFTETGSRFATSVAEGFAEQTNLAVGVFYNPGFFPRWERDDDEDWWNPSEPTAEEAAAAKAEARPILEERLTAQVEAFINYLRRRGII